MVVGGLRLGSSQVFPRLKVPSLVIPRWILKLIFALAIPREQQLLFVKVFSDGLRAE